MMWFLFRFNTKGGATLFFHAVKLDIFLVGDLKRLVPEERVLRPPGSAVHKSAIFADVCHCCSHLANSVHLRSLIFPCALKLKQINSAIVRYIPSSPILSIPNGSPLLIPVSKYCVGFATLIFRKSVFRK